MSEAVFRRSQMFALCAWPLNDFLIILAPQPEGVRIGSFTEHRKYAPLRAEAHEPQRPPRPFAGRSALRHGHSPSIACVRSRAPQGVIHFVEARAKAAIGGYNRYPKETRDRSNDSIARRCMAVRPSSTNSHTRVDVSRHWSAPRGGAWPICQAISTGLNAAKRMAAIHPGAGKPPPPELPADRRAGAHQESRTEGLKAPLRVTG